MLKPLRIVTGAYSVVEVLGFVNFVNFLHIISIQLSIENLYPVRIEFVLYELLYPVRIEFVDLSCENCCQTRPESSGNSQKVSSLLNLQKTRKDSRADER